ncbi:MAG: leucyl aminopeptidase [Egibacteraceae bacterium]
MVIFELSEQSPTAVQADVLAVFAAKGKDGAVPGRDAAAIGQALGVDLAVELGAIRFEGDLGAIARIPTRGKAKAPLLYVVGLGKLEGQPGGPGGTLVASPAETLRRAAGACARNATRDSTLAIVVPGDLLDGLSGAERVQVVTEGAGLGAYAFTTYRTKTSDLPKIERVILLTGEGLAAAADVGKGMHHGEVLVRATSLARDLVNTPPDDKRPPALAERITEIAGKAGIDVRVHDEAALTEGGFGGILGVGQGSSESPRLVELTYAPPGAGGHVVLVGKGITFDSGGLSLKPTNSMNTMKSDMSGAAAVVAAMSVLPALGVTTKVTGLLALAENMPSGTAIRVSDVLTHRGGKTVEVMNTDAEGRLVLADALAYGAELQPDAMIDLATLTGAQIVALGMKIAALMGTDDGLVEALRAAAGAAGELVWPLPLHAEYADQLESEVADLKNIGKAGQAGSIIGGLYLKEFAGGVPWAHLDIAGPAFAEDGDSYYTPKGGTGVGVRTLVRYLQARSD